MSYRNAFLLMSVALLASVHVAGYGESSSGDCLDGCDSCLASSSQPAPVEQSPVQPIISPSEGTLLDKCAPYLEAARKEGRAEALRELARTASTPPAQAPAPVPPARPESEPQASGSVTLPRVSHPAHQYVVLGTVVVSKGWWVGRYVQKRRFKRLGASLAATLACNDFPPNSNPTLRPGQALKICKSK